MKVYQLLILLLICHLCLGCNFFPKKDSFPEFPFFEQVITDKDLFEQIIKTDESQSLFFLNNNKYLSISEKFVEKRESSGNIHIYEFEIKDMNNHSFFYEKIEKEPYYNPPQIFIDKDANFYLNEYKYLSPTYFQKQKFNEINISDSLFLYEPPVQNNGNIDSLKNIYMLYLEKKYGVSFDENRDYIIKHDTLIILSAKEITNDAELKKESFEEFHDKELAGYLNGGKLPSSYYRYYYKLGEVKFKYSESTSFELPQILKMDKNVYIFHSNFGLYKVKNNP